MRKSARYEDSYILNGSIFKFDMITKEVVEIMAPPIIKG